MLITTIIICAAIIVMALVAKELLYKLIGGAVVLAIALAVLIGVYFATSNYLHLIIGGLGFILLFGGLSTIAFPCFENDLERKQKIILIAVGVAVIALSAVFLTAADDLTPSAVQARFNGGNELNNIVPLEFQKWALGYQHPLNR